MGDLARFERLFREHYREVVRFCRRRLPHDAADDVVSEVFTTTWHRLGDVDATMPGRGYSLLPVTRYSIGGEQMGGVPTQNSDPAVPR